MNEKRTANIVLDPDSARGRTPREYAAPAIHDLGSLTQLTLSGAGPLSDGFGNASAGGS